MQDSTCLLSASESGGMGIIHLPQTPVSKLQVLTALQNDALHHGGCSTHLLPLCVWFLVCKRSLRIEENHSGTQHSACLLVTLEYTLAAPIGIPRASFLVYLQMSVPLFPALFCQCSLCVSR